MADKCCGGQQNVVDACLKTGKRLSTSQQILFLMEKHTPSGGYSEEDTPHPINWYAITKYEAEKRVATHG